MAIKYQVFISSTYDDLQEERRQVLKATLEMGHVPIGMEMFSAADEEQWEIIKRQINDCDYYVVIVAHRYGSVVNGISYTEKEYDYAVAQGIPVLGFVLDSSTSWPPDRIDSDAETKERLQDFIRKVKKKPVSFCSTADELYGQFAIALSKQISSTPRPGWIRADVVAGPDVITELSRLSTENADLRSSLDTTRAAEASSLWLTEELEPQEVVILVCLVNKGHVFRTGVNTWRIKEALQAEGFNDKASSIALLRLELRKFVSRVAVIDENHGEEIPGYQLDPEGVQWVVQNAGTLDLCSQPRHSDDMPPPPTDDDIPF